VSESFPDKDRAFLADYWNSASMRRLRRKMKAHSPPAGCAICKDRSNPLYLGFNSLAQEAKQELRGKTSITGRLFAAPTSFDYRLSHQCNFKCRMCGPDLSSSHEKEQLDLYGLYSLPKWHREPEKTKRNDFMRLAQQEISDAIESRSVRKIYWAGGEPLLLDFHWQAMKRILELGLEKQVSISYNTNLSFLRYKGQHIYHDLLRHFPVFYIGASLDGTGEIGEYIRTGLQWPTWEKNFKELKANLTGPGQTIHIALCLTSVGMFGLKDLLRFAADHDAEITAQLVDLRLAVKPLSPLVLPRKELDLFVNETLEEIKPLKSPKNESVFRELEHLLKTPTWPEKYAEQYDSSLREEIRKTEEIERYRDPGRSKPGLRDYLSQKKYLHSWLERYW
jgi:sulfatase maturation enzyme AslB (radical SAM superfamily)